MSAWDLLWGVVVPAAVMILSFALTFYLCRMFSRKGPE